MGTQHLRVLNLGGAGTQAAPSHLQPKLHEHQGKVLVYSWHKVMVNNLLDVTAIPTQIQAHASRGGWIWGCKPWQHCSQWEHWLWWEPTVRSLIFHFGGLLTRFHRRNPFEKLGCCTGNSKCTASRRDSHTCTCPKHWTKCTFKCWPHATCG